MVEAGYRTGGELPAGTLIGGRYRVGRLLGRGGMGAVYEAEHVELGRQVAIKTLLPQAAEDEKVVARLIHEAKAAARIGHPGIVDVFDLVAEGGAAFVIMERLHGEELHDRIQRCGPLPVAFAVRMGLEVSGAIAAAHAHGIIHRDLKPRNVFIAEDARQGEVFKVLDFGIAKLMHDIDMRLSTRSGQVVGTPTYMAPERLAGDLNVDGRADVYAIGALMYEALTGRPPFEASSYPELVLRISSERPRSLAAARQDVPAAFVALIERSLEKSPDARPESALALQHELAALDISSAIDSGVRSSMATLQATITAPRALGALAGTGDTAPSARAARRRVLAGLALLALGGSAAAVLWPRADARTALGRGGTAQAAAPVPASEQPPPPAGPVLDPAPVAPIEPRPAATAAGSDALRPVRFETKPSRAAIWIDGKPACSSPCELRLPERALVVEAKLPGHLVARRTLSSPLPDRVGIDLVARKGGARAEPRHQPEGLPPLLPR